MKALNCEITFRLWHIQSTLDVQSITLSGGTVALLQERHKKVLALSSKQ